MMRILLLFAALFATLMPNLRAQSLTDEEKLNAMQAVYNLLEAYLNHSALSEGGVEGISVGAQAKMEELIHPDSMVFDDITPTKLEGVPSLEGLVLSGRVKTFGEMVADYKRHFPDGLRMRTVSVAFHLRSMSQRSATIYLVREVSGRYDDKWILNNRESRLEIQVQLSEDFRSARIVRLMSVGSAKILCTNCPQPEQRSIGAAAIRNRKQVTPQLSAWLQGGFGTTAKLKDGLNFNNSMDGGGKVFQASLGLEYRLDKNKGSAITLGFLLGQNKWSGAQNGLDSVWANNSKVNDTAVLSYFRQEILSNEFNINYQLKGGLLGYKHYFSPSVRASLFAEGGLCFQISSRVTSKDRDTAGVFDFVVEGAFHNLNEPLIGLDNQEATYKNRINPYFGAGFVYPLGDKIRLTVGLRAMFYKLGEPTEKKDKIYNKYANAIYNSLGEYRSRGEFSAQFGFSYQIPH